MLYATARTFRSPTAFERSKQQQPLPEHSQSELGIPATNGVVSVPTPHPPSPPLSGDESDIVKTLPLRDVEPVSSLPVLHTPPSNEFPLVVPVSPAVFQSSVPVEIPAPVQAPSVTTDDVSDKGKQKTEGFSPEEGGLESTVCETKQEEQLHEWELVDKDEAETVTANDTTPSIGAVYEIELGDKGIIIPDIQEADVLSSPTVAHSVGGAESEILPPATSVDIAIQAPEPPKLVTQTLPLEPRRLEEEEAPAHPATEIADVSIALETNVEVVPTELMPMVDRTIKGEPTADVHAELDSVEEIITEQPKREEDTEHQVQEAVAPVLEEVTLIVEDETVVGESAIDSPVALVDPEIAISSEITTPEAVRETDLEEPKADIPPEQVVREQDAQDLTPNVESEEATEILTESISIEPSKLEQEELAATENQSDAQLEGEVSAIETQPSDATQVSDDDFNRVPSVSPRIPTPQLPEKSLDWDTLVEKICKENDSDFKGEITAVPIPENVVEASGPSTLLEEQAPVLSTPQVSPISYNEFATPSPEVQYIPPPPIPPRRIEEEEKQPETPEIIVDVPEPAQSSVPDIVSPIPGPASLLAEEVHIRTHSYSPSLISRPSLADIREEVGNEDAESPVTAPPRQEPILVEVMHPVDLTKPSEPISVRKIEDEMANPEQPEKLEDKGKGIATDSDSEDLWVPKHRETDPVPPQGSVPLSEPESAGPISSTETPHEAEERPKTGAPSTKEKTGLRKLARTFSFGGSKSPISEMRPGTSHSAAVSIGSVDHDRRSVAESTASTRNKFMKTKKLFTLGLAKDKEKKENAQLERPSTADKAPSVKSAATSPTAETPPSPKLERRNTRDLMKLAIGRSKKKETESAPSSPVEGSKKSSMSNAVNLIMLKKKAQEEKVRQAEAQQAAAVAAAAKSAPSPAEVPEVKESMSPPQTPAAAEPITEVSPPPTPTKRRTLNSAVNLMMRRKAKEEKESDKPASVTPVDGPAIVSDDQATPAPIETPVEATTPTIKRRGSLSMNKAVDLMMLRKKVKEDKEEDDKVNASAAGSTVGNVAVDTGIPAEVSPPPTPSKRLTMNKAMDLMMLRKGKDKEKEKENDDSSSLRDADSSASPKKDKRITVGGMFGRKKSSPNSPTIETSNTRPATPSSPADHGVAVASPSDLEGLGIAQVAAAEPSKPSRAPSVYSVDQRPGTSASMKKFGALFKKRTPSVYSKDVPDSPSPFNAPGSPFPTASGTDRSPVTSDDDTKKSKLSRRWSVAIGGRSKSSGRMAPGSSSGEAATDRPPTSSSMHVSPVSPPAGSKIPIATVPVTSGTVPATPPAASADKSRPKLASRAKTFIAFSKKK